MVAYFLDHLVKYVMMFTALLLSLLIYVCNIIL